MDTRKKVTVFLSLMALLLTVGVLSTATLFAQGNPRTTAIVDDNVNNAIDAGDQVGTSTLIRNKSGLTMTINTTGLTPGHVVSVWWIGGGLGISNQHATG